MNRICSLLLALGLGAAIGLVGGVASAEESLAFPETVTGTSAPKFLSGDKPGEADAAARPIDWVQVNEHSEKGRYVVKNYVHKGESAANWSELFTYMNTPKPNQSPGDFLAASKAALIKVCPDATVDTINQSDSEITYESKVANCPRMGSQDEIVRVIYGSENMFRVSYVNKTAELPAAKRRDALKLLSEFHLSEK